jgi:hypothetical protein
MQSTGSDQFDLSNWEQAPAISTNLNMDKSFGKIADVLKYPVLIQIVLA